MATYPSQKLKEPFCIYKSGEKKKIFREIDSEWWRDLTLENNKNNNHIKERGGGEYRVLAENNTILWENLHKK